MVVLLPISMDFDIYNDISLFTSANAIPEKTDSSIYQLPRVVNKRESQQSGDDHSIDINNTNVNQNKTSLKCPNSTECIENSDKDGLGDFTKAIHDNSGMLFRAMFVLLGVTGIVVIYFVVRAIRLVKATILVTFY